MTKLTINQINRFCSIYNTKEVWKVETTLRALIKNIVRRERQSTKKEIKKKLTVNPNWVL